MLGSSSLETGHWFCGQASPVLQAGSGKPHSLKAFWCPQPIERSGWRIQPGVSRDPPDAQSWPRAGGGHRTQGITAGTGLGALLWAQLMSV